MAEAPEAVPEAPAAEDKQQQRVEHVKKEELATRERSTHRRGRRHACRDIDILYIDIYTAIDIVLVDIYNYIYIDVGDEVYRSKR